MPSAWNHACDPVVSLDSSAKTRTKWVQTFKGRIYHSLAVFHGQSEQVVSGQHSFCEQNAEDRTDIQLQGCEWFWAAKEFQGCKRSQFMCFWNFSSEETHGNMYGRPPTEEIANWKPWVDTTRRFLPFLPQKTLSYSTLSYSFPVYSSPNGRCGDFIAPKLGSFSTKLPVTKIHTPYANIHFKHVGKAHIQTYRSHSTFQSNRTSNQITPA